MFDGGILSRAERDTAKTPKLSVGRLSNGLLVATVPLPHVSRAHVGVCFRGGPSHEDDTTWGLSHVVEHMVFRGTKAHASPRAVGLAADRFGGDLDGATYRDRVIYDTRADPERIDDAISLLSEIVVRPRFVDVETEKQVIREELLDALDEDGQEIDADNVVFREAFGGRPLARSIDGTLDTLKGFDRRRISEFHKAAYGAGHGVVVASGRVTHREVMQSVQRAFRDLRPGQGPLPPGPPARTSRRGVLHEVRTEASQTTVRLLFTVPGASNPSRHALAMLARILDDGPAARFPSRLIDGLGLAYELWATLDLYAHEGALEIGAVVAHDRVGELVTEIVRELSSLRRQVPKTREIETVRARAARDVRDFRDHPGHVVDAVARSLVLGLPFDLNEDLRALRAVTGAEVKDAARRFVNAENGVLVLVGQPRRADLRRARDAVLELRS
jgi:predicted Zn-dependent peptidase